MARVLRTNDALNDLNLIWLHIAEHNVHAADRLIERIEHTLNLLLEYPHLGQAVDHLRKGVRRSSVGDYQFFYEPISDGVRLLRVYHAARRLEDLFD